MNTHTLHESPSLVQEVSSFDYRSVVCHNYQIANSGLFAVSQLCFSGKEFSVSSSRWAVEKFETNPG
jgi:hypothetical protein